MTVHLGFPLNVAIIVLLLMVSIFSRASFACGWSNIPAQPITASIVFQVAELVIHSHLSPKMWCFNGSSCIRLFLNGYYTDAFACLLFNIGIFCLVFANLLSAAIPGTTGCDSYIRMTAYVAWVLCNILHDFILVANLIVDGRNTYQQLQRSPQSNSNSQPEYTRLYLPVSTTFTLLPAIQSSICLDPTLWPSWFGKTCQKPRLPPL